ncbi:MAG: ribbon-helix-helix protein, CopG family [Acidimicrobiia bacterium]
MNRTTIYLDSELEARLKQEVGRLGIPMAEYIRDSIAARLDQSQRRRSPYAGAFASGRSDTSDRAEQLLEEGFGRS